MRFSTRSKVKKFGFEGLPNAASIAGVGSIEKMQGYRGFYKARFGSYRVGMKVEGDTLVLQVVMDRKDIYKFFRKPMGITQYRLAKEIGVSQRRIGEIVAGICGITADTGLRLSRFFGMSEGCWIGLQMDYDAPCILGL